MTEPLLGTDAGLHCNTTVTRDFLTPLRTKAEVEAHDETSDLPQSSALFPQCANHAAR